MILTYVWILSVLLMILSIWFGWTKVGLTAALVCYLITMYVRARNEEELRRRRK